MFVQTVPKLYAFMNVNNRAEINARNRINKIIARKPKAPDIISFCVISELLLKKSSNFFIYSGDMIKDNCLKTTKND